MFLFRRKHRDLADEERMQQKACMKMKTTGTSSLFLGREDRKHKKNETEMKVKERERENATDRRIAGKKSENRGTRSDGRMNFTIDWQKAFIEIDSTKQRREQNRKGSPSQMLLCVPSYSVPCVYVVFLFPPFCTIISHPLTGLPL